MRTAGNSLHFHRFDFLNLPFKFLIALLFMASPLLASAQTLQTLFAFSGTNGANPEAALTLGNDGNFYGTTAGGGSGYGTIFQATTNGTLTTLASFNFTNGASPQAALTQGNDGNFYGTTSQGGITNSGVPRGMGTVFRVATNGKLTTLVSFNTPNGFTPNGLTLGNDGNFYGTTSDGGPGGSGTVFRMTTNGTLTTLASFNLINGATPQAVLTQGTDGNFYGTTSQGGSHYYGTVFQVTTNGTLTTLASFNYVNYDNEPPLALGNDGDFYGTTGYGGSQADGTVFQVTTNGDLTTLVGFNGTNGARPGAALTLGHDGNFYATTDAGGAWGSGTIFQVTTNGTLTVLASFNAANGANQKSALTLGNDSNFYGTSTYDGSSGNGTIFRLLLTPAITVQPQSQTIYAGATSIFSVSANSFYPMGYQWLKNGTNLVNGANISGATNTTLTISNISDSDAAGYSALITTAYGSVTSSNASLAVNDSIFIATQPLSQTVGVGSTITFTATVFGAPPFVFQWSFNQTPVGSPTSGTNFSSFTLTNVGTKQSGNYAVQVVNAFGTLTSSNAVLTVIPQPTLALHILAGYPALTLNGILSNNFVVQYSTNLGETNWVNLLSLTNLSTSSYLFLDPSGISQPARFYRGFFTQ
jgi:uncharacterized repeat protein (TIGR03803 family)